MNNQKVSIVIPVYNAEKFIDKTIDSVVNQTYTNWELLLVNDGSLDASEQLMKKRSEADHRLKVFSIANGGAANARNYGVGQATGDYLAFLDADDLWHEDKLEKEVAFLQKMDAAFVFTGYEFADENAVGTGRVVQVPKEITYKEALQNTTIFTSTVLFDLHKLTKEALFMPQIKSEDTALWWRLLRTGITAYGLNENLVLYRRAGKSLSSNKLEALRRIWNLYRKAEHLSIPYSIYNFVFWAIRAVKRRV